MAVCALQPINGGYCYCVTIIGNTEEALGYETEIIVYVHSTTGEVLNMMHAA